MRESKRRTRAGARAEETAEPNEAGDARNPASAIPAAVALMGYSFFRSVRFGPLRFNISGRGIGVSAGIRGLRIGTGPRGAYINAGTHGFRYRASLGPRSSAPSRAPRSAPLSLPPARALDTDPGSTIVHQTRDVMQLGDAAAADLLTLLNAQAAHAARWPLALIGSIVAVGYAYGQLNADTPAWGPYAVGALTALLGCGVAWLAWRDRLRKLTVLCYDLDETTARAFEAFTKVWKSVAAAQTLWSISQTARYSDKKYHGGATIAVSRTPTQLTFGAPANVRCNIAVPLLSADSTTLAFYPDHLLLFRDNHVGAVAYSALQARSADSRYNEQDRLPSDAQVVGRTWRYVNKSGGPDGRFKNNPEMPICTYSELELTSESGLAVYFVASKSKAFDMVPKAVALLRVLEQHSREEVTHHPA